MKKIGPKLLVCLGLLSHGSYSGMGQPGRDEPVREGANDVAKLTMILSGHSLCCASG